MKKNIIAIIFCILPLICSAQEIPTVNSSQKSNKEQIYIPKDLNDCFNELKRNLPKEQIEEFKNAKEENAVGNAHMGLGRWMRNNWGLWEGNSRLAKYFKDNGLTYKEIIEKGMNVTQTDICDKDKIWSRYSHDKVDIGEELAKVIRALNKALPLNSKLRALSIGSSDEPQFRILETGFRAGLYFLDINACALNIVRERIKRQSTNKVIVIKGNYNKIFLDLQNIRDFFKYKLNGKRIHLITLHHSLYYCQKINWLNIFDSLYRSFLAPCGALHAVLMSSKSGDQFSTTWLYNHFAGKFFGTHNDQDLRNFGKELRKQPVFRKAQILTRTNHVHFFVNDFEKFMAVVWMILLYPNVHKYTLEQREEITEFIYKKFYRNKHPLVQEQDHLAIYKGFKFKGLI